VRLTWVPAHDNLPLTFPVLGGMGIRHRWPAITKRRGGSLLGIHITAFHALLGFFIVL
jgi:hypothetical protein